jgi:hypothetical protein
MRRRLGCSVGPIAVVEDTMDWNLERLRAAEFAQEVVEAVEALTRREGEDYLDL